MELNENDLISLYNEKDEDAKNILFDKYKYIIDIIIAKYKKTIYALNLDISDVKQEAMLGFTDALVSYQSEKETSLPTFISVVVERKIQNVIRNADTIKNKINKESFSLEQDNDAYNRPLEEIIGDYSKDPLNKLELEENIKELTTKIESILSPFEKDVYNLLINDFGYQDIAKILNKEPKQIDNTIQRLKNKIKELL